MQQLGDLHALADVVDLVLIGLVMVAARGHRLHVAAGAEGLLARTADDHATDGAAARRFLERIGKRLHHVAAQRVHGVGTVQDDLHDAVFDGLDQV